MIPDEWGPEEEECWDGCDAPVEIEETEETDPVPPSNDEDEDEDTDPYFSQGSSTTRSVPENSAIGSSVGSPVRAYAGNGGSLTYSIGGTNGSSFTVSSSTGQIRVNTSLDYELKNQYHVTLTVNETGSGSDTISVTINVTNVVDDDEDNDPYFSQGSSTTRSVRENSAIGSSIGSPVRAYAGNGGSLTYSIGGTNSSSFTVSSSTGQIRVNTSLDYESKNRSYVTLTVNETGSGSDSISVTINVTNVVEYVPPTPPVPPVFAYDYTNRSVPENRPSGTAVGAPVTATDPNGDRLTYSINGSNFAINSSTGQITTTGRHNYESTRTHRLTVTATDPGGLTDTTQVTIRITNVNETPVAADLIAFAVTGFPVNINVLANDSDPDGNSLSVSSVADPPHGGAVINADHTVTYTSDAAFTGQDSFTYRASDGRLSDSATVTVTVSDDCSSGIAVVDPADNPGLVLDCAILLNLGRSIKGTGSLNWSEDVLITDWDGITVDGSPRRVTVIDVRSKKLIGNIPTDPITLLGITYLDALRKIVLNNNDLNGSIPAQIGSLPNLVGLYAANSGLSGQIPVELGNLPKLENLYIYGNDLDGQIPATLGNIATLQGLDLSDNNLTGSIPTALGQLTNLDTLTLTRNQLSGSIPAALGNLNNLNWLHLQHNGLTGNLPHELGQLSNLERLGFNHNKITGGIPSELGDLRNLTHLYLARNDYADTACIPGALSYVKNHDFVRSGLPFCSYPHITEGESATRTVAENSPADTHIGNPFQLGNGADAGTVTWSISGADHTAFSIDAGSGQLRTKDPLDYETRNQYSLIVTASNDKSEFDTVVVTVHVTDVNELPVAKDDTATTDEDVPVHRGPE